MITELGATLLNLIQTPFLDNAPPKCAYIQSNRENQSTL